MKLRLLTAHQLEELLSMREASDAMKLAFAALSMGRATAPTRIHVDVHASGGKLLLMGAHLPGTGLASKVVSYFPRNRQLGLRAVQGLVIVCDEATGTPMALCDGTTLTAFRTGAGTCASIELLSRQDSRLGVLFGVGGQAAMQLRAMVAARDLETVRVVGRSRERVMAFVREQQPHVRARLEAHEATSAVRDADVVVAATSSSVPVFDGRELEPGCHVTGIGSITPQMEEVDGVTVSRCRVFVDSLDGALLEAGELIQGEARGVTRRSDWTELGAVAAGQAPGRQSASELTFFKSVGHAVQDVAIARLFLDRARERGIGSDIEL